MQLKGVNDGFCPSDTGVGVGVAVGSVAVAVAAGGGRRKEAYLGCFLSVFPIFSLFNFIRLRR